MPPTLELYAAGDDEAFELTEHVRSYLSPGRVPVDEGRPQPRVGFLQMERKTEHLDELAAFLNVSGVTPDVRRLGVTLCVAAREGVLRESRDARLARNTQQMCTCACICACGDM